MTGFMECFIMLLFVLIFLADCISLLIKMVFFTVVMFCLCVVCAHLVCIEYFVALLLDSVIMSC